ncbi:diacylglycerol kinase kappa-like [Portunus trituberculatus]|uniref:diacylglycerol kinase kappa-like n=1 Tax=Portunus trituberculatus TaxID=210409 RepID=UPI001E1D00AE|nr:diacylglycerol kinase kappa-like [Portunus trituberculatus]
MCLKVDRTKPIVFLSTGGNDICKLKRRVVANEPRPQLLGLLEGDVPNKVHLLGLTPISEQAPAPVPVHMSQLTPHGQPQHVPTSSQLKPVSVPAQPSLQPAHDPATAPVQALTPPALAQPLPLLMPVPGHSPPQSASPSEEAALELVSEAMDTDVEDK